jgi:hypothetical protein
MAGDESSRWARPGLAVGNLDLGTFHTALWLSLATVPLPPLTETGHLPVGIHHATVAEIRARFGDNKHREELLNRLDRALTALRTLGFAKRVIVDGCFLGPREEPEDIDVLVTIERLPRNAPDLAGSRREALRDLRKSLKPQIEVLWFDEGLPEIDEVTAFFQDGCIKHGGIPKGIVEVIQ